MQSLSSPGSPRKTIPDEIARKRARDRKSQRAMRERQKWTIDELQKRCEYFSKALATEAAAVQSLLKSSAAQTHENERLKGENARLRNELEEARYVGDHLCLGAMELSLPSPDLVFHDDGNSLLLPEYAAVPWEQSPPTCTSDRILQRYVESRRNSLSGVSQVVSEQPNIKALLLPGEAVEARSVSHVVSDILLSYNEINTLPKKVAVFYVMYKLVNWTIYRTQSTYDQLPGWLRPEPIQLQVPHPAWIDRIPWPHARTYLITHPAITFDEFAMVYSSSFDVSWPYNPSKVVLPFTDCQHITSKTGKDPLCKEQCISLNPVYEQHLRQLKNWNVGEQFRRKFPALGSVIDEDRLLDLRS